MEERCGIMGPETAFWKSKRVFITGHTGFKGKWLSLWLESMGSRVFGYSTSSPDLPNKRPIVSMESFQGDICDRDTLSRALDAARPEIVFHMASQPLVRRAFHDPLGTYQTNVLGTASLLDAIRKSGSVRAVLVVTTDKCYEDRGWEWPYREDDPLGGNDPYSGSKACMEMAVRAFTDSFLRPAGVGVATARAGNVVGGGDWADDRLIPDLIRSFAAGRPVVLRNPKAKRPWQFVLDALRGYLLLAERLTLDAAQFSGAWNFGPPAEDVRPVQWIVEMLARAWGADANWTISPDALKTEGQMLRLDSSKAEAELGWRPRVPLAEALEATAMWYREVHAGKDAATICRGQLAAYCGRFEKVV
jgi:CDP-glucose 4,6-dehydratase